MQMMKYILITILILSNFLFAPVNGQDSHGAELSTKQSYLYGRFEVVMQSAEGDGIVSSFFLYNLETNCNWPAENNEIDVEMTGNTEDIYFTTHHPDPVQPWSFGDSFYLNFNPHDAFHKYVMEWEPGIVRWFVDDQLIYIQNGTSSNNLQYPMAIMINLWASTAVSWVGVWDPSVLPVQTKYDYVKYYSYNPGSGNEGTNNNFSFEWEDDFSSIDNNRWDITDFSGFSPLTEFRASNVESVNGQLILTLDEPQTINELVPVTFSVNMETYNLLPTDLVYLNGTFNGWCGTCAPMTENNGIWTITLDLPPEKYEYLFTVNGWDDTGSAPLGSECDFEPCDQYQNYGAYVPVGSSSIVLDTYCWQQCTDCLAVPPLGSYYFHTVLFLEGAYMSAGNMHNNLSQEIPLNQPYSSSPYNYPGVESIASVPSNMVDWVLVEARSGSPNLSGNRGTVTVESKAGILFNDGSVLGVDGNPLAFENLDINESYYFCIRHRNHLDILSANAIQTSNNMFYDFTTSTNQAFGSNQLKNSNDGRALLFAGDFNQDGVIQNTDYDQWQMAPAILNTYSNSDANLDGTVQSTDYDRWKVNNAKNGIIEIEY